MVLTRARPPQDAQGAPDPARFAALAGRFLREWGALRAALDKWTEVSSLPPY